MFSCLLVCQPAIFVDSKRDGTGAAHGRKGFRMKRAELDRRIANGETLDDIVPALMDDGADITSYDDLKRFAIEKIESDELYLAEHVLKACLDVADYYGYEWTGRAHGSLADALATLAVQRWLEQWLVAE